MPHRFADSSDLPRYIALLYQFLSCLSNLLQIPWLSQPNRPRVVIQGFEKGDERTASLCVEQGDPFSPIVIVILLTFSAIFVHIH